jgi:hypothetical protein
LGNGEAPEASGHEHSLPHLAQGGFERRLLPVEDGDLQEVQDHRGSLVTSAGFDHGHERLTAVARLNTYCM